MKALDLSCSSLQYRGYSTGWPFATRPAAVGGGYMTITDNIHMEMANSRVRVPVDVTNVGGGVGRVCVGGGGAQHSP